MHELPVFATSLIPNGGKRYAIGLLADFRSFAMSAGTIETSVVSCLIDHGR